MPAISTGLSQDLRLGQHQILAPQMRQNLELLQAPLAELSLRLRQEADVNPAIVLDDPGTVSLDAAREAAERGDGPDADPGDAPAGEADPDFGVFGELGSDADDLYADGHNNEYDPDADERRQFFFDSVPARESLQRHLAAQIAARDLSPEDRTLAELVAGSVNGDGYLDTPLAEIAQAAFRPLADAERALRLVQEFSPAGVGARDLRECLLLQLRADPAAAGSAAEALVADPDAFALLETRDFARAAARLGRPPAEIEAAVRVLATLDPAPGRAYESDKTVWVRPELAVRETDDGRFEAFLDESEFPSVRLSASWLKELDRLKAALRGRAGDRSRAARDRRAARDWMAERVKTGRALIDGLEQRKATLLAVARAAVARQQAYFRDGPAALRPLTMAEVAETVGVDESTVSRAVSGKYARGPRGVFELRALFRTAVRTAGGETIETDRVRARIRALVAAEDPARPLSDAAVAAILAKEGAPIARRTVVKYRTQLRIPPAAQRRRT